MTATVWFLLFGTIFILTGLTISKVRRLPVTTSLLYLAFGAAIGPHVLDLFHFDPVRNSAVLERLTEIAVILSLFTAGLKLRLPWRDPRWRPALKLAFLSMTLTVGLIAAVGVVLLNLPLGAAVLLAATLAPTDPVLASDVRVRHAHDEDGLRFNLTAEAGLNDGTAFPFVMLGLGLLGLHDLGASGWKWLAVDVIWATFGGLLIGILLGTLLSRLAIHLRRKRQESVLLDDFLALGLIAVAYGVALLTKSYGFLAVFAAGLAFRSTERQLSRDSGHKPQESLAVISPTGEAQPASPEKVAAFTTETVLMFVEQLERIAEVGMVVLVGGMLWVSDSVIRDLWLVPVIFLVIRPAGVWLGLLGSGVARSEIRLISWFGIRGIGSLYYLMYAIQKGLPPELAYRLSSIVVVIVAASILIHGLSVTPLMSRYSRRAEAS